MSQGKDEFIGIGDNLKRLRGRMGLSLSEVANMTGVSKTMLSQMVEMVGVDSDRTV